jgi:hypothetical protein
LVGGFLVRAAGAAGGQWLEIPSVIHVGRRLGQIETLLRTKDVE